MAVYSMTGYASAQQSAAQAAPGQEAKGAPAEPARDWKSARSTAASWTSPSACPRNCASTSRRCARLIAGRLKRGKVEVRAALETAAADSLREPTARMLQRLNALQDNVRSWLPDARALSVADVVRLSAADAGADIDWSEPLASSGGPDARRTHGRARARGRPAGGHAAGPPEAAARAGPAGRAAGAAAGGTAAHPLPGALEGGHGAGRGRRACPKPRRTGP